MVEDRFMVLFGTCSPQDSIILFQRRPLFSIYNSYSQTKYSNEFLQIGAGSRSLGLSKAVVASSANPSSIYWNPSL